MPPTELYVARRVIDKMCVGALVYQGEETGEALIGLAIPNSTAPKLYLLDTIPPIEGTVREWAMFEQGDDWQGAIFNWYHENWELYRQLRRASYGNALAAKWDAPLIHLGDWHKQPGMIQPSRGDLRTARQFIREFKREYLLAPIVTLETTDIPLADNTLTIETDGQSIRIDFWWLGKRGSDFEPIKAVVLPNEDLPKLPPVAWWLQRRERFDQELSALESDGLQILDIVSWNTRGHPPLDTCLTIYRPGSRNVIIATTPVSYPLRPPSWRVAPILRPKEGQDLFEALYQTSQEVEGPAWKPDMLLLQGVKAIEAQKAGNG